MFDPSSKAAASAEGYRPTENMTLGDLEAIRLILRGGSVVDWRRLHFRNRAEVDRFLRLSLFDLTDSRDERRLRDVLHQAVEYLRSAFGYRVAAAVSEPDDLRDVFLIASGVIEPKKHRRIACVVLKCMHVVHHLESRELLSRTPIRESDLAERVDERIMVEARRMIETGFPIVEFRGSVKSRPSLITKLLAKPETVAAQIFDRLRYRVVTEKPEQIPSVLLHLNQTLFPFNYLVPGQSQNNLIRFRNIIGSHPRASELVSQLQAPLDLEAADRRRLNAFSSKGYRVLNFVVDLPVRIDDFLSAGVETQGGDLGRVVFSLVEFQILDVATARANEEGEANHERYKNRQIRRVLRRLSRGLVVPRRRKARKPVRQPLPG